MTTSANFIFEVQPAGSGVSDEYWEARGEQYISTWQQATKILESRAYEQEGIAYEIKADWSPMLRSQRRHTRTLRNLFSRKAQERTSDEFYEIVKGFQKKRSKIPIDVNVTKISSDDDRIFELASVENYLYDVFLIMNLAVPGSCNFDRSRLRPVGLLERTSRHLINDISLSEFYFDISDLHGRDGKWPGPTQLELEKVSEWVGRNRSGFSQIPENRMEAVMFAILHLAQQADMTPTSIIWLFYALETLFGTNPGENRRVLIERTLLLIPSDARQRKKLRKEFTKLYDLRSSLVHGGLKISHPMQNEMIDRRLDNEYSKWSDGTDFGFRLLLVALQTIIQKGWVCPEFRTNTLVTSDELIS